MWSRECTHPGCQIGGADKSKAKFGSESVFEALAEAKAISARRVAQGFEPVAVVYLCPDGYWHHATKVYKPSVISTAYAYPVSAGIGVSKAEANQRLAYEIRLACKGK